MIPNNTTDKLIQSDMKLLDIVERLKEQEGSTVTELADDLGIAKSTVHSHLMSLKTRGYVVKEGDEYHLGMLFFGVGRFVRNRIESYETMEKTIERLSTETGERSQFMIEEHGRGYFVARSRGPQAVRTGPDIGEPRFLHDSACGKAILAELPEERIDAIIDHWGLPSRTTHTNTDEDELKAELRQIRERGYSTNRQESRRGLLGVGTAIKDGDEVLASISISGPNTRIEENMDDVLNLLRGATTEIELNYDQSGITTYSGDGS